MSGSMVDANAGLGSRWLRERSVLDPVSERPLRVGLALPPWRPCPSVGVSTSDGAAFSPGCTTPLVPQGHTPWLGHLGMGI